MLEQDNPRLNHRFIVGHRRNMSIKRKVCGFDGEPRVKVARWTALGRITWRKDRDGNSPESRHPDRNGRDWRQISRSALLASLPETWDGFIGMDDGGEDPILSETPADEVNADKKPDLAQPEWEELDSVNVDWPPFVTAPEARQYGLRPL